jgi:transketolase
MRARFLLDIQGMPSRFELANAIRALSMDAVEKAKSGHPGMPMGMADIAEVLWNDFLKFNPRNPNWFDRDRFVLSNGHGSMLLYSLLHLTGFDLSLDELKRFRQLNSLTPGHPEAHHTPGVETTTGPLGQGLANAVGMALAEKLLALRFNREDHEIVDHMTYCFVGDGCLMEGISHEVCSLAGTLKLGKLVLIYDANQISIDGDIKGWFTDDSAKRFESYGFEVIDQIDGHNPEAIKAALVSASIDRNRPTIIVANTTIGFGAPSKAGKESSHGAPLGAEEITGARIKLNWPHAPFHIPEDIYQAFDAKEKGALREQEWLQRLSNYRSAHPDLAAELARVIDGSLPQGTEAEFSAWLHSIQAERPTLATRKSSQNALQWWVQRLPELIGGSADLAHSNLTLVKGSVDVQSANGGNYVYFGVREFGMSAIANGMALHGGVKPFTATFLVFSDYARNAVRMSALIPAAVTHVYTHDSIGLGEDGPTHQPIEHLASLRLIPNNSVWRPCDAVETAVAWHAAITRKTGPTCLALTRQNTLTHARSSEQVAHIAQGAYVLHEPANARFEVILIGTGSEVTLVLEAARALEALGIGARVVSMPNSNVFDQQALAYRESVLPSWCRARVAVEAAASDYWYKYVGLDGNVIGMNGYGASAPAEALYSHFGITTQAIVDAARSLLTKS